ncbi:hypothetical protein ACJMK2_024054 [Sinanodonta woodiana]|uniref:Sodium/calcium exchanger membrane region domain-containing protein n=1 Tax=Sinanodonta woodiana TaxID=1069815 RepID=A0ABD3T6F2_SINWO
MNAALRKRKDRRVKIRTLQLVLVALAYITIVTFGLHFRSRDFLQKNEDSLVSEQQIRLKRDVGELRDGGNNTEKKCTHHTVDEFPPNFFTTQDTKDGGVFLHILIALYLFAALAIICDDYFVSSLERICEGNTDIKYEALIFLVMYALYITIMYFNRRLEKKAYSIFDCICKKKLYPEESETESLIRREEEEGSQKVYESSAPIDSKTEEETSLSNHRMPGDDKPGFGDMAVSNSIGSNVFDILACLGVPWLIDTLVSGKAISIRSGGLLYSSLTLLATVVYMVLGMFILKWKLNKRFGALCLVVYVIVTTITCLFELNIIGNFNDDKCA